MSPAESILLHDLRHFQVTGGNDLLLSRRDVATLVALLEREKQREFAKGCVQPECSRCRADFGLKAKRYVMDGQTYCLPCIRAIAPEDSHE